MSPAGLARFTLLVLLSASGCHNPGSGAGDMKTACDLNLLLAPQCGVDGETYPNPSFLACAGVALAYVGSCDGGPPDAPDLASCPAGDPGVAACGGVACKGVCVVCTGRWAMTCEPRLPGPDAGVGLCFPQSCDGPEDCLKGQLCMSNESTYCAADTGMDPRLSILCHHDCDCPAYLPRCDGLACRK